MKTGDLVFVIPERYWEHDDVVEAKFVDVDGPLGLMYVVQVPGEEKTLEVPSDRVFWMRCTAEQSMRLMKELRGLRETDGIMHRTSESLDGKKQYEDEPKNCTTCRYCDSWKRKSNPFPWMPKDTACYHRHPVECGPDSDWQHWKTRNLEEDEDYWTGRKKACSSTT